jgi:hypothetical protein
MGIFSVLNSYHISKIGGAKGGTFDPLVLEIGLSRMELG